MSNVLVDGVSVPLGCMYYLRQKVPFPGGHNYELRLSNPQLLIAFRARFGSGVHLKPSREDGAWVFSLLRWATVADRREQVAKYFANTIDVLEISETELLVRGECSDVVSAKTHVDAGDN